MLIDRSVSISKSQLTSVSHVAIFLLLYIALERPTWIVKRAVVTGENTIQCRPQAAFGLTEHD